ncbi:MAG TPA: 3',5'-cyclic-AMP phosphodiesterase [Arsenophonus nasoniae]|uniref:3',5'-cyclic-AMP phosphodiesterase n=1 Tax=Arsenophonus nasoniae TaxID=638 RepID=UPI0038799DC2
MDSLFKLTTKQKSLVRILQITDTHLFANADDTLLGVNTFASFHAVIDAVLVRNENVDLVVATGDLAQDQSAQAYQHFAEGIKRLSAPCVWLPGNHDYQPAMVATLAKAGILPSKQLLINDNWQILMLDSQIQGAVHGKLSKQQLLWMKSCFDAYTERSHLLMLHHHPLPSGCTWLDQHRLRNSHILADYLKQYQKIKAILCGHIHQEIDEYWQGVRMMATPSTCIQFKPHCTNFTLDTMTPGWRYLDLSINDAGEDVLNTQVCRLDSDKFCPDLDSGGY